jgi:hypothetical protein
LHIVWGCPYRLSAIIMAYHSAIIIASMDLHHNPRRTHMNARYGAATRNPRNIDRSIVTPPVLIDTPPQLHARKAAHSISIERRRSSATHARPRMRPRNDEFRYFIDRQGRQHFNFRQRIWLDPSVQMACTGVYSLALKTLAVNLLTMATRKRDYRAAVGLTSRRVVMLAPAFSRECLLSAPDQAWALPKASIRAWLESRLRARASARL